MSRTDNAKKEESLGTSTCVFKITFKTEITSPSQKLELLYEQYKLGTPCWCIFCDLSED